MLRHACTVLGPRDQPDPPEPQECPNVSEFKDSHLLLSSLVHSFVLCGQTRGGRMPHGDFGVLWGRVHTAVVDARARLVVTGVVDGGAVVVHVDLKVGQVGVVVVLCARRPPLTLLLSGLSAAQLEGVQKAWVVFEGALQQVRLALVVFVQRPRLARL